MELSKNEFQSLYSAWEMMEMFGQDLSYVSLSGPVWRGGGNIAQGKNTECELQLDTS